MMTQVSPLSTAVQHSSFFKCVSVYGLVWWTAQGVCERCLYPNINSYMANSAANLPDEHRLTHCACVLASVSPSGLCGHSSRAHPTCWYPSWIFLCHRLHSWRHTSKSCAWGKSEKRREPRHPSSIVGMISFWVITLAPQHSETHPQVINPRLSAISLSESHETCRIHVVVLDSWREFEWCHLLDPARNPKLASYPTTLFLSMQLG